MADTFDAWAAFLNPDVVRPKLISAGLFLLGHEMLVDVVKSHPLEFFATRWTPKGPEPSEEYRAEILALDPKKKNDAFRGSIAWLRKMDALSAKDESDIRTLTDARNSLAHEMTHMFRTAEVPPVLEHFPTLLQLVQKVETWWIINVEIPTDPDFDGEEINYEEIISGSGFIMTTLTQVALGHDDEAWDLYRGFMELRKTMAKR